MIYFIVEDGEQYVKIGYSAKPKTRLWSLRAGNPRQLNITRIVSGDRALERALHGMFAPARVRGEWFVVTDAIRLLIEGGPAADKILAAAYARTIARKLTLNKIPTVMILTKNERMALKYASGDPYSHGAIVGGVRALLEDWDVRGRPVLLTEKTAAPAGA